MITPLSAFQHVGGLKVNPFQLSLGYSQPADGLWSYQYLLTVAHLYPFNVQCWINSLLHVGGLKDTVLDFHPETQSGTGWTFAFCDAAGLMHAIGLALHTFREFPEDFEGLQTRGMKRDSSWNGAAEQYEQIFEWALIDQPYA